MPQRTTRSHVAAVVAVVAAKQSSPAAGAASSETDIYSVSDREKYNERGKENQEPSSRPTRSRVAVMRAAPAADAKPSDAAVGPASSETDIYDVSDREKYNKPRVEQTAVMVARGPSVRTRAPSASATTLVNPRQAAALELASRSRDVAMQRLENITSTETGATSTAEDSADDSDGQPELGRKATTHRRLTLPEVSGLDLDDSTFDEIDTTVATAAGPSGAQRSYDMSTSTVNNFRRRPRAGSFLAHDAGPVRPSSRAGPTTPSVASHFILGGFKKRTRQPSILGSAQKGLSPRPNETVPDSRAIDDESVGDDKDVAMEDAVDDAVMDNEAVEDEVDADPFAPEAESTRSRRTAIAVPDADADADESNVHLSSKSRKRKSIKTHHRRSRSSAYADSDSAEFAQSATKLFPPLPSTHELGSGSPVSDKSGEVIAPPMSSDSEAEGEVWPPIQSLGKARARRAPSMLRRTTPTPPPDDNMSTASSPPSLTYSPHYAESSPPPKAARRTKAPAKKADNKVTTAALTGLLPRRRQRVAHAGPGAAGDSDYELDASGLGSYDDELSYLDVQARRGPANRTTSRAAGTKQRGRSGQTEQQPGSNKRTKRTYGRPSDHGDEEQEGDEDEDEAAGQGQEGDEDSSERPVGDELIKAAEKFQEVDKWELEYEEMTHSSSHEDAR